ncbi:MAG: hypothetical protein ACRDAM_02910 [Casimicrobium sp.]
MGAAEGDLMKTATERILYPRRIFTILAIAGFGVFALLLGSARDAKARGAAFMPLLAVLYFSTRLVPSLVYLKLTHKGFEYRNILPAKFVKWSDVDHFTTYTYKFRYVGWVYSDLASVSTYSRLTSISPLPRSVGRFLGSPIDDGFVINFETNPYSLATLLEQWRKEHDDTTWVSIGSVSK